MKITIHRGTHEIGGCVTEYEYNGWKLFVDFGEKLPGASVSNEPLKIEGLTYGDLSKSALIITHYHGDHIGKIYEIAKSIPVYMGYTACEIYRKLQRRLSYIKGEAGEKAKKAYERSGLIHTFMDDEEFQFGPFLIQPVKMDHSAYDAYGFVISIPENEEGDRVFHTGDFRAHGMYGEQFWDKIQEIPWVRAIVCEATNIDRNSKQTETEINIGENFEELFKKNKYNSVFVSSTNIDRIFEIYNAARNADRVVLMDEYQYDILNSVIGENDWSNNELEEMEGIDEDGKEFFDTLDARYEFNKGLPYVLKFDRTHKDSPRFFVPDKIRKLIRWKGFVLIARTTPQFQKLIDSFPAEKSRKYLSQWRGYVDQSSPAYNESLADVLGEDYQYIHTSGHADRHTLATLFERIEHEVIIPMHTNNPKKFLDDFQDSTRSIRLLNDGESFDTMTDVTVI